LSRLHFLLSLQVVVVVQECGVRLARAEPATARRLTAARDPRSARALLHHDPRGGLVTLSTPRLCTLQRPEPAPGGAVRTPPKSAKKVSGKTPTRGTPGRASSKTPRRK